MKVLIFIAAILIVPLAAFAAPQQPPAQVNAVAFGADPTGVADSSAAFNAASASLLNGVHPCVYAPAGTYYLLHAVTTTCLVGDGQSIATFKVDQSFDSSALGVIVIGPGYNFPVLKNFGVSFAQPSDQTSRANFLTLAQHCTSASGGTGCKYPPAVYDAQTGGRMDFENLLIAAAWDGITFVGNSGAGTLQNIYVGALDVGFQVNGLLDDMHVHNFHFWPFGISGGTPLEFDVFEDGNTFATKIGRADGINVTDMLAFAGRLQLTSAFSFGTFENIQADTGSDVEINGGFGAATYFTNLHQTGVPFGSAPPCAVNVAGGIQVLISNAALGNGVPSAICFTSAFTGQFQVTGSRLHYSQGKPAVDAHAKTGIMSLFLTGNEFAGAAVTATPLVSLTSSDILTMTGNNVLTNSQGGGNGFAAISGLNDSPYNVVQSNGFYTFVFTPPGDNGYYQNGPSVYITAVGKTHYALPTGYGNVRVRGCGWGGPGGSGAVGLSSGAVTGGGGGGSAFCDDKTFPRSIVATAGVDTIIGSAPVAGTAVTTDVSTPSNGVTGTVGGAVLVATGAGDTINLMKLDAGGVGSGGQAAGNSSGGGSAGGCGSASGPTGGLCGGINGGAGGPGAGSGLAGIGGSGSGTPLSTGASSSGGYASGGGPGGGGSGGGSTNLGGANNGGNGGFTPSGDTPPTGGTSSSPNGTTATTASPTSPGPGGAGGWGGPNTTAAAGTGGAGVNGSGGGGGGVCIAASGVCTSGSGGLGGNAFVEITPLP